MFQCLNKYVPFPSEKYLLEFNSMKQTQLEIIESIDMNRIIENGGKVKMEYSMMSLFQLIMKMI